MVSPPKNTSDGSSRTDEDIFYLADGTSVDSKCSFEGDQAFCTAVLSKASMTTTVTFTTGIPTGSGSTLASSLSVTNQTQSTGTASSATDPTQSTVSQDSSGSDHFHTIGLQALAVTVALAGVIVGILL